MTPPPPSPRHLPVSTYRVQLSPDFSFGDAAALAPYLERLGVTTCYCSPILAASPGSTHGYDICDHSRLNPALGGDDGFRELTDALERHALTLLVDHVPNHMSIDAEANRWWRGVLENGPSSEFARFFDVDWDPVIVTLKDKVLLPVLSDQYGVTLENGDLQIAFEDGGFSLHYFDLNLPLNPRELRRLLRHNLESLEATEGSADAHLAELQSILFHLDHMPAYTESSPDQVASRSREKEVAKQRLVTLVLESPVIRRHLEDNVRVFNGTQGDPASFDLLHELLERQAYRLSYWRTAMHEINYRRFFDINQLAAIRVEEPEVFMQTHALMADLVARGVVHGLRLDHVDGLFDPAGYLEQLAALLEPHHPYLVVEKILSGGEPLPSRWRVHGTTGYDFMNDVNGLFIDGRHAHELKRLYARFTGERQDVAQVIYRCKKLVIAASMASELNVLAHQLDRISEQHRRSRDFTLTSLREALREIVACFPVYRTNVGPEGWTAFDEHCVDEAVSAALARNPATEASIFHFIRQLLLPVRTPAVPEDEYQSRVQFAMKFQQYTGPVQAKGVEDTAFYRHAPLLSLNEVGGDPERFGRSPDEFHRANLERQRSWPLAMLATSTHDAKRGEDARARINVLSEIPREWRAIVSRWARANASARVMVRGKPAPDRHDEYLFYQALLGAWPAGLDGPPDAAFVDRMRSYMQKAVKEAKVHTSWINPSPAYDDAIARFVSQALAGAKAPAFLRLFLPFAHRLASLGAVNSLAQLVLKVASPGVPDFYQGTELWDLTLVDPDNRRPIDFSQRGTWLAQMEPLLNGGQPAAGVLSAVADMLAHWHDGRIKLYCTAAGLHVRRRHADLFLTGDYLPLPLIGDRADHVTAFARHRNACAVIAIAPRLVASLYGSRSPHTSHPDLWGDLAMTLPPALSGLAYRNVLTGEPVSIGERAGEPMIVVADALGHVPAALLLGERQEDS